MEKTLRDLLIISATTLLLTALLWLPFFFKLNPFLGLNFSEGFAKIYRNYDGPNYIVIAKSFYNPEVIAEIPQQLPSNYYPAHFPGYPLLISAVAPFLGHLNAMLFISVFFTILSAWAFYFLVRNFELTSQPLWLSLIFLILPARWVIVHSVGSPEPVFIFFTILAIYYFLKFQQSNNFAFLWLTGLFASMAQLVRPPGILLFISLFIYLFYINLKGRQFKKILLLPLHYFPLNLVPLTLLLIFGLFYLQTGDFFAYFHSGDNIHLTLPPFPMFNKEQYWVGDIWLEDIVYIFLFSFLGGILLLKSKLQSVGFLVLIFITASVFVAHRDIARYVLPVFPFVLIAFEKVLISKEFKIATLVICLGIYLYALNYMLYNTAPIPNLEYLN